MSRTRSLNLPANSTLDKSRFSKTRALNPKKIPKPAFDYESWLKWLDEPREKLVIEIGCGVGLHPIQWAKANPQSRILAIERTQEKFERFAGRLARHPQLKNIFAAHADAAQLLPHLLSSDPDPKSDQESIRDTDSNPQSCVDEYFVLYPNPYPKAAHKNRRFAYHPLTDFMARTLKSNGRLIFATNIKTYADELEDQIPTRTPLRLLHRTVVEGSSVARTHFEKKYLERGETCHSLVFIKP